jgi:hypothetical protein
MEPQKSNLAGGLNSISFSGLQALKVWMKISLLTPEGVMGNLHAEDTIKYSNGTKVAVHCRLSNQK